MNEPEPGGRSQKEIFWTRALVIVLILAGLVLTAYFGSRLLHSAAAFHRTRLQPGTTDVQLIRGWMTIPYIARAYRVPENDLWQGLHIPSAGNRHKNLRMLDQAYASGQPGAIISQVREIILTYQAQHPPTPAAPSR